MIVLKIIGAILYAVLKVAVVFLQIALTILAAFVSFGGGIGRIIGGLFIMASLMYLATGQVYGHEFWMMFLVGLAFGAIPAVAKMLGEEGIYAIKGLLSKI